MVNPNPATNLETVQEAPSAESLATQAETGQKTGELTSPVTSTELDKVVTDAKEAGVTVTEDSKAIVYDNLDQAQADLAKQTEAVQEATVKQEANTTAIKEAEEYNKAEKERVEREFQEALAEWEKQKTVIDYNDPEYIKAKAEYDKAKAVYDRDKAAREAHNAQAQAEYDAIAAQIENQDVGNPSAGIQGHSFPVGEFHLRNGATSLQWIWETGW